MVILPSGKTVQFDFARITIAEFRNLVRGELETDQEDDLIGRVAGLTADEIGALPYTDYVKLQREFIASARNPLVDPN